jgi:hypothetical protein
MVLLYLAGAGCQVAMTAGCTIAAAVVMLKWQLCHVAAGKSCVWYAAWLVFELACAVAGKTSIIVDALIPQHQ